MNCNICDKTENLKVCSRCRIVYYCSTEHQKQDWKTHKNVCKPIWATWSIGLSKKEQAEWLIDCYRMRVDDIYVHTGELQGIYNPDSTAKDIFLDFLLFNVLSEKRFAFPDEFDFQSYFSFAKKNLFFAFEKSDAQEKYGGENVFSVISGGRSLRFTAELIYGRSVQDGVASHDENKFTEKLENLKDLFSDVLLFEKIGGVEAWKDIFNFIKSKK
jgi:hypothetical protein